MRARPVRRGHGRWWGAVALCALLVGLWPAAVGAEPPDATCTATPYLTYINQFRAQANLPLLTENAAKLVGDCNHSRYVVKATIVHGEDSTNPWYTTSGNAAGLSGNVAAGCCQGTTYQGPIDLWMTGPFHGVGMIDPTFSAAVRALLPPAERQSTCSPPSHRPSRSHR